MEAAVIELSPYELERGKPMPDTIHAIVQGNLLFELRSRYGAQYRISARAGFGHRARRHHARPGYLPQFCGRLRPPHRPPQRLRRCVA